MSYYRILQDENHLGAGIHTGDILECVGQEERCGIIYLTLKYTHGYLSIDKALVEKVDVCEEIAA